MRVLRIIAAAVCSLVCNMISTSLAEVIPDGGTATTVSSGGNGRSLVDIAGAGADGVSHNTYSSFSVPLVGVDLDNADANANLIINEVTSTRRSFLNGPLEVQGRQAHVVIANPNGITIDGARFVNTGGVVLSGGRVHFEGEGSSRQSVVSAGSGDILVEGAGLSGMMTTLQMIAGRMKVDGPVVNDHASPFASVDLTAGNGEIVLDQRVSPNSTTRDLVSERRRTLAGGAKEVMIDVTPRGTLSASRVRLAANGDGAGVRFAGRGFSSIGEFSIDADGKVSAQGAFIRAERSVSIAAAEIEVLNTPERQASIESVKGAATLVSLVGDIDITGRITGAARDGADPLAQGGVTMIAAGDIRLLSENASRLAIVFASDGDLVVEAGGEIVNASARLFSNDTVSITARRLDNRTDMVGASREGDLSITRGRGRLLWPSLWTRRRKTWLITRNFGAPRIAHEVGAIQGASVDIQVTDLDNTGVIRGLDGNVIIDARRLYNHAQWMGAISVQKNRGLAYRGKVVSDVALLGGEINATRGVTIQADEELLNEGGTIMALGNMEIASARVLGIAGYVPQAASRPAGLDNGFVGSRGWVAREMGGGVFVSPEGSVSILSDAPVVLDGGDIIAGAGKHIPGSTLEFKSISGGAEDHPIGLFSRVFR